MSNTSETMGDQAFVNDVLEEVSKGRRVALATVLATKGSAPRHAGARMAMSEDGVFLGTVGGGRIEQMAQCKCRELLLEQSVETPPAALEWISSQKVGMMCGGSALIACRIVDKADLGVLQALASRGDRGGLLIEDWSNPCQPTWSVGWDDGEAEQERDVETEVSARWDEGESRYVERLAPNSYVYLFGGGHVAFALVPVLASVGFSVVVADERPEMATPVRFPDAVKVVCCDYRSIEEYVSIEPKDFVVVMTPSHAADLDVLKQAVACRPFYAGCIGSKKKAVRIKSLLEESGVSREDVDAIHIPIGDSIDAVTPAEIAISITAEMIRCRARKASSL